MKVILFNLFSAYLKLLPRKGRLANVTELAILDWLRQRHLSRKTTKEVINPCYGVDFNEANQLEFVAKIMTNYADEFNQFNLQPTPNPSIFYLRNKFYQSVDAEILHTIIRHYQPHTVIEVGSGNSTRITHHAMTLNGSGSIISIDPYPRCDISNLVDDFIQERVENVPLERFTSLKENDILFIDSSHRLWPENDVKFLFEQVLPILHPGVLIHIHDIFSPMEYPEEFLMHANTEQDFLQAFLAFNSEFQVLVSAGYLMVHHQSLLDSVLKNFQETWTPGCFWMQRRLK
jgi:predicted O-methyltransferase YrrM